MATGSNAPQDPETRQKLAKEGRLWLMSLLCAGVGAFAVWRANSVGVGVVVFLSCVVVFGGALFAYERRLKGRQ